MLLLHVEYSHFVMLSITFWKKRNHFGVGCSKLRSLVNVSFKVFCQYYKYAIIFFVGNLEKKLH